MVDGKEDKIPGWLSRILRREQWPLFLVGLFLTLVVAALSILQPAVVREADLRLYDMQLAARMMPPQSAVPLLVGIDEASLASYGQWPWPRYRLANLIERLQRMGAEVIVLDFLMPEPDRTSPEVILAERQRDHFSGSLPEPAGQDSNSARLARALAQGKSVLGYYQYFSGTVSPGAAPAWPALPAQTLLRVSPVVGANWPRANGEIRSLPSLVAASAEGFTNAVHDFDGVLRRVPLLLPQAGGERLSLALAGLLLASSERSLVLSEEDGEAILRWQDKRIPLDAGGNLLLDFRGGARTFSYLSAGSILRGEPAGLDLHGRIVLVGAWATGLGDMHQTPLGREIHGLEVHATIIDNVLSGRFVFRPAWARGVELLLVLLLGITMTLLLQRDGIRLSFFVLSVSVLGSYWLSRQLLVSQGVVLYPLLPMSAPILVTVALSLLKYGLEVRKVQQRTRDLIEAHDTILVAMSTLAEARDRETGLHLLRTRRYVGILARRLSLTQKYAYLQASDIDLLAKSAPLHDIGKVGIPDNILHKPGKLSEAEYKIMQAHPLIGAEALTRVLTGTGHPEKNTFLIFARQMVEAHHERWDGKGYPHGLRGEEIPLPGRLMALADVYDAMVSRRVYKKGMSHEETRAFIFKNAGSHFDPDVVAAFAAEEEAFISVAQELSDEMSVESAALAGDG